MEGNNQDNKQDPRLIQPQIIGELQKDKIGKPLIVIELFLLFGIVLLILPTVNTMLNDENSDLYKMIYGGTGEKPISGDVNKAEFADGKDMNLINDDLQLIFDNLVIKDIKLLSGKITCTMKAYTDSINLDEKEYFLIIYAQSEDSPVGSVKLIGNYDITDTAVELDTHGLSFNANYGYKCKIVDMAKQNYPEVEIENQDTTGLGTITCVDNTRTITYTFQNRFLVKIEDEDYVKNVGLSTNDYLVKLENAKNKATNLGAKVSSITEVEDGFKFTAIIDYNTEYVIPESVVDFDYYPENTLVDRIVYTEKGKGYDCR